MKFEIPFKVQNIQGMTFKIPFKVQKIRGMKFEILFKVQKIQVVKMYTICLGLHAPKYKSQLTFWKRGILNNTLPTVKMCYGHIEIVRQIVQCVLLL